MQGSPRSGNLSPGFDEDDPYEEEDLESYPQWWKKNITEFQNHGMRPYRPPRFRDGELTTEVISTLEEEFNIEIRLQKVLPKEEKGWEVLADGECVATIDRRRDAEGYTVYDIQSAEFEGCIQEAVDSRGDS